MLDGVNKDQETPGAEQPAPPQTGWVWMPELADPQRPTVGELARAVPAGFASPEPGPAQGGEAPGSTTLTFYRDRPAPVPTPEHLATAPWYITGTPAADDLSPWAQRMRALEEARPDGCPCRVGATEDGQETARVIFEECPVHW
jgi:hypothetical protein